MNTARLPADGVALQDNPRQPQHKSKHQRTQHSSSIHAGSDDDETKEDAADRQTSAASAAGVTFSSHSRQKALSGSMHDIPLQEFQYHSPLPASVSTSENVLPPPIAYKGKTIATAAATGDLPEVVLLWSLATTQGHNLALPDEEDNTPLHHAALAPTPEVAAFIMTQTGGVLRPGGLPLVRMRNANGETPLLRAATAGHLPTLKYLIEQDSDVTATDTINGNTIFHNTCRNGHLWALVYLVRAAAQAMGTEESAARLLLQPDNEDHTCLDWACFGGHISIVQFLLRRLGGSAARRVDGKGRTGLHLAGRMRQVKMCRYLVNAVGLDPSLKDATGQDVWSYAVNDKHLLQALQGKGKQGMRTGSGDVQEVDNTPTRANPVRPSFLVSYAGLTAIAWTAPFFIAWYIILPALVLFSIVYRYQAAVLRTVHQQRSATKPPPRSTWVSEWFQAHERYVGFWAGSLLAFAATLPIIHLWPVSTAWSTRAEAAATSSESSLVAAASFSLATMLAMYVALALTGGVWADLVLARPDPGILHFKEEQYDEMMAQVAVTATPVNVSVACPTCMIRKPLRSKHCRECGFCVARMDHHCVWLDGCVGLENHGRFLVFLVLHIVSTLLFLACVLPFVGHAVQAALPPHVHDASQVLRVLVLRPILPLLFQSLFALGTTCSLLALLFEQVRNVLRNFTSNERINGTRYAYITSPTPGRCQNLFDKGDRGNVREFMGWGGKEGKKLDYRALYDLSEVVGRGGGGCCEDGRHGGLVHGQQQMPGMEKEGGMRCEGGTKNDAVAALPV